MLYETPSFVYGRVPLLPYETALGLFNDSVSSLGSIRSAIGADAADALDKGIMLASPALSSALTESHDRASEKATAKYRSYAVRAGTRTAPYASFSSVGVLDLERHERLSIGARSYVASVDMEWLRRFVRRYDDIAMYPDLRLYRNPLSKRYGDRLGLIDRRKAQRRAAQPHQWQEVFEPAAIALTRPVELLQKWLSEGPGLTVCSMIEKLSSEFGVSRERASSLLQKLYDSGFFISEAWPSPFRKPLTWLREQAQRYDAQSVSRLERLECLLPGRPTATVLPAGIDEAMTLQRELCPAATQLIRVDGTVRIDGCLPNVVLEELRAFAELSIQINPPGSLQHLQERLYRRYESQDRLIPLVDVMFAGDGVSAFEERRLSARDQRWQEPRVGMLGALVERHWRSGVREVRLEDLDLKKILYRDAPNSETAPRALEVGFQICATDADALAEGDFLILPTGLFSNGAGKSLARMAHALPPSELARLDQAFDTTISRRPEIVADLAAMPSGEHFSNVVVRPPYADAVIAVGCTPNHPGTVIELDDLYLGQDERRLFLWSRRLQNRVYVLKTELAAFETLDPLSRTLEALVFQQEAQPLTFEWSTLRDFPFLPRLVYRKIVLARARWNFRHDTKTPDVTYDSILDARSRADIDRYVRLRTPGGDSVLLDLDSKFGRELLRQELGRIITNYAMLLEEMHSVAWLRDGEGNTYAAEFVASLHRATEMPVDRVSSPRLGATVPFVASEERRRYPGREWFYAKLFCDFWMFDAIIGGPLQQLLTEAAEASLISSAFFLRYGDPLPHIRLRFQPKDASTERMFSEAFSRWCDDGVLSTFEIGTYVREVERYGSGNALGIAEEIFAWSTVRAMHALGATRAPDELALAALSGAYSIFIAVIDEARRRAWLERHKMFNTKLRGDEWALIRKCEAGRKEDSGIATLGARYAEALAEQSTDVLEATSSLIHMHCNRLGVESEGRIRAMLYRLVQRDAARLAGRA